MDDSFDCVLAMMIGPDAFCFLEYGDLAGPPAHAWLMSGGNPWVVLALVVLLGLWAI